MKDWNFLDMNTVSMLKEEMEKRLLGHDEAMIQLTLGVQRAEQVVASHGKTFPWMEEVLCDIAVHLTLTSKLMPLQEAIQYGRFTDELTKRQDRAAFAEALYACFNVTPKNTAIFGAFVSQPSEDKQGGTYFQSYLEWEDLSGYYQLASKWGASNCWQLHGEQDSLYETGYKAYGAKWYNRVNQDGSTRPVDVLDIMGKTPFVVQEDVEFPAYTRSIDPFNRDGSAKTERELGWEQENEKRITNAKTSAAEQYVEWGEVYFSFYNCYRVRTYAHGAQPHPQGCDWDKGLFEFKDKRPLNQTGKYWLKVAVANTLKDFDKKIFSQRVAKVDDLIATGEIHNLIQGVVEGTPDPILDEPCLFRNLAVGLLRGLAGEPVGSICHVDATASGLQVMAAAMGDITGMLGSNVIDDEDAPEERMDPYLNIYNKIMQSLSIVLSRSDMKYICTMPWMYGGSAGVRRCFGEDEHFFYQGAASLFPSAYKYLTTLQDKWGKKRIHGECTMPDGVKVHINRVRDKHSNIRTALGTLHLTDKEIGTDGGRFVSHLSALIHGLDGWVVRECIRHMHSLGKPVLTVHDSFGVHPNDVPQVQLAYKRCMCRLVQEPLLQNMLKELFYVDFGLVNPLNQEERDEVCGLIMKARYILC